MNEKHKSIALFRLMVLGPLASRAQLVRGELKKIVSELADQSYNIPHSSHSRISPKTIERWYYDWLRGGFEALSPKKRADDGRCKFNLTIQEAIISLKKENPSRSLNTLIYLLEAQGMIAQQTFSRATLHRFLQKNNLSKRTLSDAQTIERRSFQALHAGDIWQGDVMHGPAISTTQGKKKVYLVSLMDDASRLMAHSAFCFGETALDIEGVLKQALLKRGIPKKLIIDNGPAYRSKTLQMICANLGIRLIYCKPYEPEGKGKLERFHRTFREQFLSEIILDNVKNIEDLNIRLWAWLEEVYHQRVHNGLDKNVTPIERWRQDLKHVQSLGSYAKDIDDYFYHRVKRRVKKDGSVTWEGALFEVPYTLSGKQIYLVVDPHTQQALKVESLEGAYLGEAFPLNKASNLYRKRQRPVGSPNENNNTSQLKESVVERAHQAYQEKHILKNVTLNQKKEEN